MTIRRSKTDQEQAAERIAVRYARAWALRGAGAAHLLEAAELQRGAVLRRMQRGDRLGRGRLSDHSVALVVKRRAGQAGLPPELLSGHSLRAGYATAAARAGIEERKIANVTRHENLPVLRSYIRAATAFDEVGELL